MFLSVRNEEASQKNEKARTREIPSSQNTVSTIMFRKSDFIAMPELAVRKNNAVMQRMAVKNGNKYYREKKASWIVHRLVELMPNIDKKTELASMSVQEGYEEKLLFLTLQNMFEHETLESISETRVCYN